MSGWKRIDHGDLHDRLCQQQLSDEFSERDWIAGQALRCPYYVPLEGKLGADWGVIVNPTSTRFGLLTFEHDTCGCPERDGDSGDPDAGPIHVGCPAQDGDMWDTDWSHVCDTWCDKPCEWAAWTVDDKERAL